MAQIKINLSEKVISEFEKKAQDAGYDNMSEYISHLLDALAKELEKGDPQTQQKLSEDEKIAQRLRDLGYI